MLQVGEYERAVEDYSQAVQVDPHNSYAYYNRGITRDRSGDYEGAITDFSHAIDLDPANADFFHNRGFSLRKMVSAQFSVKMPKYGPCSEKQHAGLLVSLLHVPHIASPAVLLRASCVRIEEPG